MSPFAAWTDAPCFIVWRGSDKSPINPLHAEPESDFARSDAQKPATWLTYDIAAEYARALGPGYGVGVVLHPALSLMCIDLDGCVIDGQLTPIAQKLIAEASAACPDVYIEYSMSGRGVHIIGPYIGGEPPHSTKNHEHHMEMYTQRRYIALTGNLLYERGAAGGDLTAFAWSLAYHYFKPTGLDDSGKTAEWTTEDDPRCTIAGSDDERIAWLLDHKSFVSKIDKNKLTFADYWNCDIDKLAKAKPANTDAKSGLPYDGSSIDQGFFNHLAYAFANNCDAIRRVALEHPNCKLRREKWGRNDYIESTILKAVALPKKWRAARIAPITPTQQYAPPPPPSPVAPPPPSALPKALPEALFSCTDQANAQRLQRAYGPDIISIAGDFHSWDGKRWKLDDGEARRLACDLSRMVLAERSVIAAEFNRLSKAEAEGVGDELVRLETEMKMLGAWAAKCENVSTQNNALTLLRDMLGQPVERMDANPWLLNVNNGTIDLRSGELLPHSSSHLITKIAPINYDPAATCPRFVQFLHEIFQGDQTLVDFLQRWYGYAVTGDAREQKILIKHGPGGNGKGTLTEAIDAVLGEYNSPATMGLLTGRDNAGSTAQLAEIADLRGKRLVTASESEDGAKLKEAQMKQLTGGDSLKGKRLYGQLFSFKPTHKLELLTNHKPVIKGSDFSIWRRIMLLSFPVKYGSAEEVAAGEAMVVKDAALPLALRAEMAGILAWIVRGTSLWLAQGLAPPIAVLNASAEYRQSQDHVAEFLAECCTLTQGAKQMLPALYRAYTVWCNLSGRDHPVTRQRLVDELERRVPGFVRPDIAQRTAQGTYVLGLTVNPGA